MVVITKSNRQHIYGLTSEQRDLIKDSLTFSNPAYKNAKRYSRSKYISIPPYLTYYNEFSVSENGERKKVLNVPIGVNIPKLLDYPMVSYNDLRRSVPVKFPKFNLELREDQVKAEKAYMQEVKYSFLLYPI